MSGLGALKRLFHGGRRFSEWDPRTINTGEGHFLAQGPGLYAGDQPNLAKRYLKYGGENPALSELLVDDTRIFNPALKMSDSHKAAYNRAVEFLDSIGMRATNRGLRGALMEARYPYQRLREGLIDSGIDGLYQHLNEDFGNEYVIFNPNVIKSINLLDKDYKKGGLVQMCNCRK